jgi:hypothetical protein
MLTGYRHIGGKAGNAAAAFVLSLDDTTGRVGPGYFLAGGPEAEAGMFKMVARFHCCHQFKVQGSKFKVKEMSSSWFKAKFI